MLMAWSTPELSFGGAGFCSDYDLFVKAQGGGRYFFEVSHCRAMMVMVGAIVRFHECA